MNGRGREREIGDEKRKWKESLTKKRDGRRERKGWRERKVYNKNKKRRKTKTRYMKGKKKSVEGRKGKKK